MDDGNFSVMTVFFNSNINNLMGEDASFGKMRKPCVVTMVCFLNELCFIESDTFFF